MKTLQFATQLGLAAAWALGGCASPGAPLDGGERDAPVIAAAISARPPRGESLVVVGSTRLKAGEHYLPALGEGGDLGVVVVEEVEDATLDLRGVALRGLPEDAAPDASTGTALVLRGCKRVRVLGGELRGYRVGVLIEDSQDVTLEGLEVTRGFAGALSSTAAAVDPQDELTLEDESWFEDYGAGIFVRDSSGVVVRDCVVRESQNGLIFEGSGGCEARDNDFSFLSGWGIALRRSEGCELLANRCDFVARGVFPGRYAEDLGAAGIFLGRGASDIEVVGNSAVRCSLGVRIQGEPSEALTGVRVARNDLSAAAFAALRAEHTRDLRLCENDVLGRAPRGFELRDATRAALVGNRFERVFGAGVALLDSQECVLEGNELADCDQALEVRGGAGHWVRANTFEDNLQDLVLEDTEALALEENDFSSADPGLHLSDLEGLGEAGDAARVAWMELGDAEGEFPSGRAREVGFTSAAGVSREGLAAAERWLATLGPEDGRGVGDSAPELVPGEFTPWDPASGERPPDELSGLGLFSEVTWEATWFEWGPEADPRGDLELWRSLRYEPTLRARVGAWTSPWGSSARIRGEVGGERFGLHARTDLYVSRKGTYLLGALSDDGLRIWIDGEVVYEDWTWHPARRETIELDLEVGRHSIEFEYFQIDGAAELALELDRARE